MWHSRYYWISGKSVLVAGSNTLTSVKNLCRWNCCSSENSDIKEWSCQRVHAGINDLVEGTDELNTKVSGLVEKYRRKFGDFTAGFKGYHYICTEYTELCKSTGDWQMDYLISYMPGVKSAKDNIDALKSRLTVWFQVAAVLRQQVITAD